MTTPAIQRLYDIVTANRTEQEAEDAQRAGWDAPCEHPVTEMCCGACGHEAPDDAGGPGYLGTRCLSVSTENDGTRRRCMGAYGVVVQTSHADYASSCPGCGARRPEGGRSAGCVFTNERMEALAEEIRALEARVETQVATRVETQVATTSPDFLSRVQLLIDQADAWCEKESTPKGQPWAHCALGPEDYFKRTVGNAEGDLLGRIARHIVEEFDHYDAVYGFDPESYKEIGFTETLGDALGDARKWREASADGQMPAAVMERQLLATQASGNALYRTIVEAVKPHYQGGPRDLEWDVLPQTLGWMAREWAEARRKGAGTAVRQGGMPMRQAPPATWHDVLVLRAPARVINAIPLVYPAGPLRGLGACYRIDQPLSLYVLLAAPYAPPADEDTDEVQGVQWVQFRLVAVEETAPWVDSWPADVRVALRKYAEAHLDAADGQLAILAAMRSAEDMAHADGGADALLPGDIPPGVGTP